MLASLLHTYNAFTYSYGYHTSGNGHWSGFAWVILGIAILFAVFIIVCMWKVFQEAGRPGWAAIIPIYNTWVLLEMGDQPGWWALVALLPFVGFISIIFVILAYVEISKRFGKSPWFALLLVLLPFIGWPILAFGDATYHDNSTGGPGGTVEEPPYPAVAPPSTSSNAPTEESPKDQTPASQ